MSAVVAVLVGLAVLVGRGPGGRRPAAMGSAHGGPPARSRAVAARGWSRARRRRTPPDQARDLADVVTDVVSQLQAGSDPGRAWALASGRPVGADGIPALDDLATDRGDGARRQAGAVVAAGRLASVLGAPLAQVLERVAAGLADAADADGERRAALAGPRATARVLTGLPVLGVVLGAAVGADPVRVLLGGGAGTSALLAGVALVLIGRWWIARLVRAAARAGWG